MLAIFECRQHGLNICDRNIWLRPVYEYNIEDIVWSFDLFIERRKIADAGVANKLFDVKCDVDFSLKEELK